MLRRATLAGALLLVCSCASTRERAEGWIAQLEDPELHLRAWAVRELERLGPAAHPTIRGCVDHDDSEVAHLCRTLLPETTPPPAHCQKLDLAWYVNSGYNGIDLQFIWATPPDDVDTMWFTNFKRILKHKATCLPFVLEAMDTCPDDGLDLLHPGFDSTILPKLEKAMKEEALDPNESLLSLLRRLVRIAGTDFGVTGGTQLRFDTAIDFFHYYWTPRSCRILRSELRGSGHEQD